MLIVPAIDIKNGQCVRLRKGDMNSEIVFSDSPLEVAHQWSEQGARRLHLVDLDGAVGGQLGVKDTISTIAKQYPQMKIQVGGGIRNGNDIEQVLSLGAHYAILGTLAVRNTPLAINLCRQFRQRVIISIDAQHGQVATNGWLKSSALAIDDLVGAFADCAAAIIYTNIERDGMLNGCAVEETRTIAQLSSLPVFASGGVSSLNDIAEIAQYVAEGICGMVIGRALYENKINLAEAIKKYGQTTS